MKGKMERKKEREREGGGVVVVEEGKKKKRMKWKKWDRKKWKMWWEIKEGSNLQFTKTTQLWWERLERERVCKSHCFGFGGGDTT